jgi:hypothetical protein
MTETATGRAGQERVKDGWQEEVRQSPGGKAPVYLCFDNTTVCTTCRVALLQQLREEQFLIRGRT